MSRPGSTGLRFGMFAVCVTRDPDAGLNAGKAKPLYDLLVTFADVSSRDTGQGYPYREALASCLDCSKQTVDRAGDYLEKQIGLVTIHRRKVEGKPDENDANLYEIHDAWLIHGVTPPAGTPPQLVARYGHTVPGLDISAWVSEHAPEFDLAGWRAAYDEKLRVQQAKREEQRRKERARRKKAKGGGVMGDATGGVVNDATGGVVDDALSRAGSPEPTAADEAPSGRSPVDGRRPSDGSKRAREESGCAASGKTPPSPTPTDDTSRPAGGQKNGSKKPKHTRDELNLVRQVRTFYPPEILDQLPELPTISDAILSAMRTDGRTVEQIGERILYRWLHHNYAAKFHAGELENPVGAAIGMVRPLRRGDRYACPDAHCENGADIITDEECRLCAVRAADWKGARARERADREAAREHPPVSEPAATVPSQPTRVPPPLDPTPQVGGGAEPNEYFRKMRTVTAGQRTHR
ncbi:hypothetical protein AB0D12_31805 [Streptomyces sp. NPDC048479]|uniref:hypothetical protein n=1 Tax=Streptomyces sp. NPDC048479 TaxID=3154725 RepID=UPI0034224265